MANKKLIINRRLPAAVTGLLLTLCQATPLPWNFGLLAWVALVPLLVTLPERNIDRFISGAIAGGIHYITGLYWMAGTLHTYGNLNISGGVFVALLLAALETSFFILFTLAWGWLKTNRPSIPGLLAIPVLWVAMEFFRTHVPFGGFPWLLIGYSQQGFAPTIQFADITGVYGISFIIVFVNTALAEAMSAKRRGKPLPLKVLAAAGIVLAVLVAYGYYRIDDVKRLEAMGKPVDVSLLQGNIRQDMKWSPAEDKRIMSIYRNLSREAAQSGAQFIVWPEASTPYAFERDRRGLSLFKYLKNLNVYTLLGSVDYTYDENKRPHFTNSAYLIGPEGMIGKYSKTHLVPFGEYIPLVKYLGFVDKIVKGAAGNYSAGEEMKVFESPWGRFGVIICYEAIFGDLTRRFRANGADLLVNITNDAWFGDSSAPRQHLAMAAFRCAENHCYLIRAANTGISAVVDPTGRILARTGVMVQARLNYRIRMMPGSTFYARHGDLFAWIVSLMVLAGLLFETGKRIRDKARTSQNAP